MPHDSLLDELTPVIFVAIGQKRSIAVTPSHSTEEVR